MLYILHIWPNSRCGDKLTWLVACLQSVGGSGWPSKRWGCSRHRELKTGGHGLPDVDLLLQTSVDEPQLLWTTKHWSWINQQTAVWFGGEICLRTGTLFLFANRGGGKKSEVYFHSSSSSSSSSSSFVLFSLPFPSLPFPSLPFLPSFLPSFFFPSFSFLLK